ncbi:FGGY family carbohydrate kinase [Glaciibacter superstes]|uniref:FGGY family carbohydrate kinase n=1 Tax=Glaciibacter superstes TaxID=501023 RepID=UPI0003B75A94|nr:FGGY family carbohydrate kinase [Glaciibacter superstes]
MTETTASTGKPVIVAVDQGTSATKVIVVDSDGAILSRASVRVSRADPAPGWVQQDALEIRDSVISAVNTALEGLAVTVVGLGLSNQRESAVIWDRETGQPLGPLLGWQDRRTAAKVAPLEESGWAARIRAKTGLPLDPMFSALKFQWLLDQVDADRSLSRAGRIAIGTVDAWVIYTLTGEHRIEVGNASRTQLLNLETIDWDQELLDLFQIPRECMPRLAASNEPTSAIAGVSSLPDGSRFYGVLGDSHAALYAHGVRSPGQVKATYGSGSSVMGLIDPDIAASPGTVEAGGLVRTIAWAEPEPVYAFEGTILSTGATLLWLAQVLGMEPAQLSALAESVENSQGVDLVPAFAGLGAPWWDETAVAVISGFGLGTGPAQLAHAAFESVALQTEDLFRAAEARLGTRIETVLTDGGPSQNDWLMQLQADLSRREVVRSNVAELSATGAAHLAGISSGLWTVEQCGRLPRDRSPFSPSVDESLAEARCARWRAAVARSRFHAPSEPGPAQTEPQSKEQL